MTFSHGVILFAALFFVSGISAAAVDAQKLHGQNCASCHGKDGSGNKALAGAFKVKPADLDLKDEDTANKSDEDLAKIIAEGKGKMPPYAKTLKPEEQKALLDLIRSWAPAEKKDEPAPSPAPAQ